MRPLTILLCIAAFAVTCYAEQYFLTLRYLSWSEPATTQPAGEDTPRPVRRGHWDSAPPADAKEEARYVINVRAGHPFEVEMVDDELEVKIDGILTVTAGSPELRIRVRRKLGRFPEVFTTTLKIKDGESITRENVRFGAARVRDDDAPRRHTAWQLRLDGDPRAPPPGQPVKQDAAPPITNQKSQFKNPQLLPPTLRVHRPSSAHRRRVTLLCFSGPR